MNGMRKALFTAAAVVAATGFAIGMSAPAQAGGHHGDDPAISLGNNLCAAPWNWDGPVNALQDQPQTDYSACQENNGPSGDTIAALDNACVAPWLWEGPGNVLVDETENNYDVCKHNG